MGTITRGLVVAGGAGLLVLGLAATAAADAHGAEDEVTTTMEEPVLSEPHVAITTAEPDPEYTAAADPDRYPDLDVPTKPWAYDTGYFFALTRGLEEESLSTWGRRASMAGTLPLDVVGLPTAALAGLFGS